MIFEGTLEERARRDLGEDATPRQLWRAICEKGDLVQEKPLHTLKRSDLRPTQKRHLELFLKIRQWYGYTGDAIPISMILAKGKSMGYMDYSIKQALRIAWKMGMAVRYIEGIFHGGLNESKVEEVIIQHELSEEVAAEARKFLRRKAVGGRSHGVHYILWSGDK